MHTILYQNNFDLKKFDLNINHSIYQYKRTILSFLHNIKYIKKKTM